MPGAALASPRIQWLLALAAFCMLAQSTLLPVTTAQSVWSPVHRHITVNGVVPPHTHDYDRTGAEAGHTGCVVTDVSSATGSAAHNESLVCAPDDGAATSTVTIAVQHEAATLPLTTAGVESLLQPSSDGGWYSISLGTLTPPPRA